MAGANFAECDWCGKPFGGEIPVPGYDDQPTHERCRRIACREWRVDQRKERGLSPFEDDRRFEREPFTDWPNGQGTYD